ncbi:hypothetical protein [Kitasatospora sp. NPDC057738]|uniref:hypothetical protein n=1 Tax=Kitasatospora sp. NPDC057738 TaxID=3346233 RepID=UPI00369519B4
MGTGRVRVPARRFEKHVRTIEQIFDETSFREVPGELLTPGTRIETFDRTPYRLPNGHGFYNRPERREGLYFPKRDGAGTVVQWNKTWIADNDTSYKVFLCFDGRYFIDQMDITWADGEKG